MRFAQQFIERRIISLTCSVNKGGQDANLPEKLTGAALKDFDCYTAEHTQKLGEEQRKAAGKSH